MDNLPGWRWVTITKVTLDRLSRSLHSDVCDSDGLRDAAIHSTISGSGGRRDCAASYESEMKMVAFDKLRMRAPHTDIKMQRIRINANNLHAKF